MIQVANSDLLYRRRPIANRKHLYVYSSMLLFIVIIIIIIIIIIIN